MTTDTEFSFDLIGDVAVELYKARLNYPPMNSLHEGYAVMLEEVEEVWQEVKKKPAIRDEKAIREELIQVAAMAIRTIGDCIGWEASGD